jgi:hypothetical protein
MANHDCRHARNLQSQSMTGTIKLYNDQGDMLKRVQYYSQKHRSNIILKWREQHPDGSYIQIVPEITIKVKSKAA